MRVRHGWSGEVKPNQWAKFDVELEEEDLRRLLAQDDITIDPPVTIAFRLLELEAHALVYYKLVQRYGLPAEEGRAQITAARTQQEELLADLKAQSDLKAQANDG